MTCSLPINMASYQIDSPPTQLLTCLDDWISSIASKKSCYIVYLDFQKAFDTVCYSKLLCKLDSFGITGPLLTWIEEYLSGRSQRVCIGEAVSDSVPVTSEIIQGSILGPLYTSPSSFILFINDLLDTFSQVSCTTFADDAKLYSDDPAKLQQPLTQVEELCHKWQLSISVEKCSILRFIRGLCMQFVV